MPDGAGSNAPVSGFQTCSESTAALKPSHATTLPFESIDACTATIGQATGAAHAPTWSRAGACAAAGAPTGFAMSAAISAAASARS